MSKKVTRIDSLVSFEEQTVIDKFDDGSTIETRYSNFEAFKEHVDRFINDLIDLRKRKAGENHECKDK